MALTKSAQALQASASNTAGSTTTGSAFTIGYGVSGVAVITNGATGPTIPCDFVIEASNDGGVSAWFEISRQSGGTANNGVYRFPFSLGVCGAGGDWDTYRVKFTGNTAQSVTVQADGETTTAL